MQSTDATAPIVIGGLGGSGTRVVARILREAGVYIGDVLNEPHDNLWFTLLFRRPSITNSDSDALLPLLDIFHARMHGNRKWSLAAQGSIWRCATEFMQHNYVRSARFRFPCTTALSFYKSFPLSVADAWGWKEPNAHVFLPLLMRRYPNMRYVHVLRHPLDAVLGSNKLQLYNWRHLFDIRNNDESTAMLRYFQLANRRALELGNRLGENFLTVRIEDLCNHPSGCIDSLLAFCGLAVNDDTRERLYAIPDARLAATRYDERAAPQQEPLLSEVCAEFGYALTPVFRS